MTNTCLAKQGTDVAHCLHNQESGHFSLHGPFATGNGTATTGEQIFHPIQICCFCGQTT